MSHAYLPNLPFKLELSESLDKAASDKTRPGLEINSPGGCSELCSDLDNKILEKAEGETGLEALS